MIKNCPICNSSKLVSNGKEIQCKKCGWTHKTMEKILQENPKIQKTGRKVIYSKTGSPRENMKFKR